MNHFNKLRSFITLTNISHQIRFVNRSTFSHSNAILIPIVQKSTLAAPKGFHENISALQTKKRGRKNKKTPDDIETKPKVPGVFNTIAFSSAEEYDLERIVDQLNKSKLYVQCKLPNLNERSKASLEDVVYASAKYQVEDEPREIFFFREGTVVFWNCSDLESSNILNVLKPFEVDSYNEAIVQEESEIMDYEYTDDDAAFLSKGTFFLTKSSNNLLEKFTFSNAMALSVKLSIWESSLENYIDSIEFITEDLKRGKKIKLTRHEVLQKHGELLALRHLINLSSDLLDTPDFYWEQDDLERLYQQTCTYFSISKRTKVVNEKLSHCLELIELLESHLNDKHGVHLELVVIYLIVIEVLFEIFHYFEHHSEK